ncbi:NAD(P)-binding protein [Apiospora phragmitis]|uniref:3-dehydrosphinganine reductase n=1 Tax=Apiospora phragmitis TaxID=2905665 RepID=A0ABR1SR14_9PEZI
MPSSAFEVRGRTAVITGGSRGMGLAVARQLAEKGANVVIVARDEAKLLESLAYVKEGATGSGGQRFHQIRADLTSPSEAVRVLDEVASWNGGNAPDIVWCCAGSSYPTLFVDTPVFEFQAQMDQNFFTGLYMAHAAMRQWLRRAHHSPTATSTASVEKPGAQPTKACLTRHLIFTSSFVAFFSFAGYSPYSPSKAALRSLSDTLSQEVNLYAAANPEEPKIRLHTIFPAGILSEGYEAENRIKSDLTKLLEAGDTPLTPDVIAARSIKGLESGQELITTDFLTGLVKRSMLSGSLRGGFLRGCVDWILAGLLAIVMVFVRGDFDKKVRDWGTKFGASGMKTGGNGSA